MDNNKDNNETTEPTLNESPKPFADGIEESLLPEANESALNRRDSLFKAIGNYYESQRGKRR